MRPLAIAVLTAVLAVALPVATSAATPETQTIDQLEQELTGITEELTRIEQRIDSLLKDLIDPRITSLTVFFSVLGMEGRVPVSLELRVDDKPFATREFSETDRLVLIRGGAVEVFGGIVEPVKQSLTIQYQLAPVEGAKGADLVGKSTFSLEPKRASANFLEVTLALDTSRKPPAPALTAKQWAREP